MRSWRTSPYWVTQLAGASTRRLSEARLVASESGAGHAPCVELSVPAVLSLDRRVLWLDLPPLRYWRLHRVLARLGLVSGLPAPRRLRDDSYSHLEVCDEAGFWEVFCALAPEWEGSLESLLTVALELSPPVPGRARGMYRPSPLALSAPAHLAHAPSGRRVLYLEKVLTPREHLFFLEGLSAAGVARVGAHRTPGDAVTLAPLPVFPPVRPL